MRAGTHATRLFNELSTFFRYLPQHRSFSVSVCLSAKKSRMPPKKAPEKEKKALLGRPSNNLKIGIVGRFAILVRFYPICVILMARMQVSLTLENPRSSTSSQTPVSGYIDGSDQMLKCPIYDQLRSWKGCQLPLRNHQS